MHELDHLQLLRDMLLEMRSFNHRLSSIERIIDMATRQDLANATAAAASAVDTAAAAFNTALPVLTADIVQQSDVDALNAVAQKAAALDAAIKAAAPSAFPAAPVENGGTPTT